MLKWKKIDKGQYRLFAPNYGPVIVARTGPRHRWRYRFPVCTGGFDSDTAATMGQAKRLALSSLVYHMIQAPRCLAGVAFAHYARGKSVFVLALAGLYTGAIQEERHRWMATGGVLASYLTIRQVAAHHKGATHVNKIAGDCLLDPSILPILADAAEDKGLPLVARHARILWGAAQEYLPFPPNSV